MSIFKNTDSTHTIGITLDGVIRNSLDKFDEMYRKKYIKNPSLVQMNENFEYVPEDDSEDEFERLENLANSLIHLPMTTYDLRNHYTFETKDEYEKFMYVERVLEIFGSAPQFPKSMDAANRLQAYGEQKKIIVNGVEKNLFNVILICQGPEQTIAPTWYFLTKNSCRLKHVLFTNDTEEMWKMCDLIITDNPTILTTCPSTSKYAFGIKRDYNQGLGLEEGYEFESLHDVLNNITKSNEIENN